MTNIRPEALEFLKVAKEAFDGNKKLATYSNENFIAVRSGLFEDGVRIFETQGEVGNFVEQLERPNIVYIDKDEYDRLKKIEKESKEYTKEKLIMTPEFKYLYRYNDEEDKINIEIFQDQQMLREFLLEEGYDGEWRGLSGVTTNIHRKPFNYL